MNHSPNSTSISMPSNYVHFTPNGFFAANNMNMAHPYNGNFTAIATRPPKLLDQPIQMPKKGRRNSRQQEMTVGGQIPKNYNDGSQSAKVISQHRANGNKQHAGIIETTIFATPQRRIMPANHQHLRREHSASIIIPSRRTLSANFLRYTPPTASEDQEVATVFAGSKFIESPSAKSLPLPPSQWLENNRQIGKKAIKEKSASFSDVDEMEDGATTSTDDIPGKLSLQSSLHGNDSPSGIRMNPLHLIAAAVIST